MYFATLSDEEIGLACIEKINVWQTMMNTSVYRRTIINSHNLYYGIDHSRRFGSLGLGRDGSQGERTRIKVNKYKTNTDHLISLLTQNKAAFNCQAVNTDPETLVQAQLGNSLIDYTIKEKRYEAHRASIVKYALNYGDGWTVLDWDVDGGEDFSVKQDEKGKKSVKKTGDITLAAYTPFEMVRDLSNIKPDMDNWFIFPIKINRYEVIEKYAKGRSKVKKELKSRIMNMDSQDNLIMKDSIVFNESVLGETVTDDIYIYEMRHRRMAACPKGKIVKFLSDGSILQSADLPFKKPLVFNMSPGHQFGSSFGHSPIFHIQGLQKSLDRLSSTAHSNNFSFGAQSIICDNNTSVGIETLKGGFKLIRTAPGSRLEALQLTKTAPELYNLMDRDEKDMAEGAGLNEAAKGDPPPGITSGVAIAFLSQTSLQFLSGLDNSKTFYEEEMMSAVLNLYKDFAETERVIAIVGRNKKSELKLFKGSDIIDINRVTVQQTNPLTKTLAGKVQLAEQYISMGLIKTPADFHEVIETGNLAAATEYLDKENLLVKSENDRMLKGEKVKAMMMDDHVQHIREHRGLVADDNVRYNSKLSGPILSHIMEHIKLYRKMKQMDPELLAITQEADLQGPQAPGGGSGGPQGSNPLEAAPSRQGGGGASTPAGDIQPPNEPAGIKNPNTGQPIVPGQIGPGA